MLVTYFFLLEELKQEMVPKKHHGERLDLKDACLHVPMDSQVRSINLAAFMDESSRMQV